MVENVNFERKIMIVALLEVGLFESKSMMMLMKTLSWEIFSRVGVAHEGRHVGAVAG